MVRLLDNTVTGQVLSVDDAIDALGDAFRQVGEGNAAVRQLHNVWAPDPEVGDSYRYGDQLGALADPPRVTIRIKSDIRRYEDGRESRFNVQPGVEMRFVLLFDTDTGELLSILKDRYLQQIRVGATAGLACDHLAREDADTVAILGSGQMARTHAKAFAAVRELSSLAVYSPTRAHREEFATEMEDALGAESYATDTPDEAVRGADIVATCTDSSEPVFLADWIEAGQFITCVRDKEIDEDTWTRVDRRVMTTNQPYSEDKIGDVARSIGGGGRLQETDHPTLDALVTGRNEGRLDRSEAILFDNRSSSIQFTAIGNLVFERAAERDIGTQLPLEWFQQQTKYRL